MTETRSDIFARCGSWFHRMKSTCKHSPCRGKLPLSCPMGTPSRISRRSATRKSTAQNVSVFASVSVRPFFAPWTGPTSKRVGFSSEQCVKQTRHKCAMWRETCITSILPCLSHTYFFMRLKDSFKTAALLQRTFFLGIHNDLFFRLMKRLPDFHAGSLPDFHASYNHQCSLCPKFPSLPVFGSAASGKQRFLDVSQQASRDDRRITLNYNARMSVHAASLLHLNHSHGKNATISTAHILYCWFFLQRKAGTRFWMHREYKIIPSWLWQWHRGHK